MSPLFCMRSTMNVLKAGQVFGNFVRVLRGEEELKMVTELQVEKIQCEDDRWGLFI